MSQSNYVLDKNEVASLGASLREISSKILKSSGYRGGTKKVWFQGEEPYFDVFFELRNNQIAWFQFTLRGKSLSWDSKAPGLQTGTTDELKLNDVSFYAASKTIETDNEADLDFINLVKLILQTRADEDIFAKALKLFS
ncbi:MAG: hypothetical protein KME64_09475 [Scytonematopsis contorta HA4267-MV1]|jgi:hypothetical protein|nr:hypothetical protein [Scytonematopsis contorta HA4267-MV1]